MDKSKVLNPSFLIAFILAEIFLTGCTPKPLVPGSGVPTANSSSIDVAYNTPGSLVLSSSVTSQPSYVITSSPTQGTLTGTPPNLVYTPAMNFKGTDRVVFHVIFDSVASSDATVLINVSACSTAQILGSPYASGAGTSISPYLICTATQLQSLGQQPSDWGLFFKLMSDIDLSSFSGPMDSNGNSLSGSTPFALIGNDSTEFTGDFDGNNHVISNFSYGNTGGIEIGLFGSLSGSIENLGVEAANVSGKDQVGIVVGLNDGGSLTHVHSTGTVNGGLHFCSNSGHGHGGVVCAGGLVVGGLVGESYGTITTSFSTATVLQYATGSFAGGLSGDSAGSVSDSFAAGSVTASDGLAGGLMGSSSGDYTNTYATGAVSGASASGGLIAQDASTTSGSFWDTTTTLQSTSDGVGATGLATSQMKLATTFVTAGWSSTLWNLVDGTYPTLK